jgi:hypothetical protein
VRKARNRLEPLLEMTDAMVPELRAADVDVVPDGFHLFGSEDADTNLCPILVKRKCAGALHSWLRSRTTMFRPDKKCRHPWYIG